MLASVHLGSDYLGWIAASRHDVATVLVCGGMRWTGLEEGRKR